VPGEDDSSVAVPVDKDTTAVESSSAGIATRSLLPSLTRTATPTSVPSSHISFASTTPIQSLPIDTRSPVASKQPGGEHGAQSNGAKLSAGAISGIVIGALVFAAAVVLGVCFMRKKVEDSAEPFIAENNELNMTTDFDTWMVEPNSQTSEIFRSDQHEAVFVSGYGD
jgi:hypothetical protein